MIRQNFLSRLGLVKAACLQQDFIPVYSHFCFDGNTVTAYNEILALQTKCDLDFEGALHADTLLKLLSKSSSKEIQILDSSTSELVLKAGRSRLKLPSLPSEDFLFECPNYEECSELKIDDDFLRGIQSCLIGVGEDLTYSNHMGITLSIGKNPALYSTDQATVSAYYLGKNYSQKKKLKVLLPTQFCYQLLNFSKEFPEDITLKIDDSSATAFFEDYGLVFTKIATDNTLPDFESLLDNYEAEIESCSSDIPKTFTAALDRATVLLSTSTDRFTEFTLDKRQIRLVSSTPFGEMKDSITVSKASKGVDTCSANPNLLFRILTKVSKMLFMKDGIVFTNSNFVHIVLYKDE